MSNANKKELFFQLPLCSTGYGQAGQALYRELLNLDINIILYPFGNISIENKEVQQKAIRDWDRKKIGLSYSSPTLRLWHQHSTGRIGHGPLYHFPIFELDEFTPQEKYALSNAETIIVCTDWAKQVCINNGFDENKVKVCPLGVDQSIFKPRTKPVGDKYIFAAGGKMSLNKGYDVLAEIFNKAFTIKDNVELFIFGHNPFLNEQQTKAWIKLFKDSPMGGRIKFFPPFATQAELAFNLAKADAFIAPNRAEGLNLVLLEAMSIGLPAIATFYSGHTQYLTKENAYLVDITDKEIAFDNQFFTANIGSWAKIDKPQIDQFVDHMQYLYNNRINSNPEGIKTAQSMSWSNSARILSSIIFPAN